MGLKNVDFSKKYFECQGKKFTIKDTLGFVRWKKLQEFALEFGFSATFLDIFKNVRQAHDYMDKVQFVKAAVTLNNILVGIKNLDEKDDVAFRICALFMDEQGEDATGYDEGLMKAKIDCWAKELAAPPFIQWAATCVPGYLPAYKIVSQDGLEKQEQKS